MYLLYIPDSETPALFLNEEIGVGGILLGKMIGAGKSKIGITIPQDSGWYSQYIRISSF